MDKIVEILIYIHAGFGGLALFSGGIALVAKKGKRIHKKSGLIFYYSMLTSAIIALFIAMMPNHESPFLFSIGLFSMYFLLSGYRSLNFKNKDIDLRTDKAIAYIILLTGSIMILYPLVLYKQLSIILLVFGMVGLVFGFRDIQLFNDITLARQNWLKLHVGKMTGGYIAAVSAYFVVNQILPGIWNWFVPGIVGSVYITYWILKLRN